MHDKASKGMFEQTQSSFGYQLKNLEMAGLRDMAYMSCADATLIPNGKKTKCHGNQIAGGLF